MFHSLFYRNGRIVSTVTFRIGESWDIRRHRNATNCMFSNPEVSGRGLFRHCVMNEEAVILLKNERMRTKHLSPNV